MKKTVGSVFFAILFCVLTACENGGVSLGISSDNKMSTLSVSQGTLMPAFSPDVFKYSASVNYMDSTFDLTFSPSSSKAVCIVNGEVVTGNTARVPLAVGTNTIVVSVTAEDGTMRSYTIVVTRAEAASAPDLQSLALSSGTLSPTFAKDTISYTASVAYPVSSVNLTAALTSSFSTMTINGQNVASGTPIAASLNVGANLIPIVVTAQDNSTKTYSVTITRAAASVDSNLASLALSSGTLSPVFASGTISYTASVLYAVSSINVTASPNSTDATFTINGQSATAGVAQSVSLSVGSNAIPIVVTAQNGTTKTYTVTVTRGTANTTNTLTGLTLSAGTLSPTFASGTTSYTVAISDIPTSFTATGTTSNSLASLQYRLNSGTAVNLTSGVASNAISPSIGSNTLEFIVTAESGTTRTYTVTITYSTCQAGYYSDNVNGCSQVGLNYYSPANDNARYACANKPANSRYTSPIASSANCPWSCSNGYITTNGTSCTSSPTATTLSCNDDEIAVGLYGKEGSIIDRIGVRCATIDAAGNLGSPRNGPDYGGTGGGWFNDSGVYDCPAGYAVYRIEGSLATYSSVPRTGAISFQCKSVTNPAASPVARPNRADADFGNSYDRGPFAFECGVSPNLYGAFLNGIIIDNASGAAYAGDTLGITCR